MKDFNFWQQVLIREAEACELARVEYFSDVCKSGGEGFVAKGNMRKAVKQLVSEVDMLVQLPHEFRNL